jgi:uncharacterized protein (DUF2461 family)
MLDMDFPLMLKFLKDLAKNNDREWFEKNKPKYLAAKESFDEVVASLMILWADLIRRN